MFFLDAIVEFLNSKLGDILFFLPDSPLPKFWKYVYLDNQLLSYVNWFIPLDAFVAIGSVWLLCVSGYYIYSIILRWVRAVE